MALLDQLFRLRGAPRSATPPVTLGALAAAIESGEASDSPRANASGSTPNEAAPALAPVFPAAALPIIPPVSGPAPAQIASPAEAGPGDAPARNGIRFNPFAAPAEENPAELLKLHGGGQARPAGPCLDDPTLPPLRLQAHMQSEMVDQPRILGTPSAPGPSGETEAASLMRQIEPPAVRLAPVKLPASATDLPAAKRPMLLRLEIQADSSLDVVAFKQYVAKFPGVVKCAFSHARD